MFRFVGGFLACLLLAACGPSSDRKVDNVTAPVLPIEASGWAAAGDEEVFDTESIFAYIDGHAEVYLAYGMKRCVSRRYAAATARTRSSSISSRWRRRPTPSASSATIARVRTWRWGRGASSATVGSRSGRARGTGRSTRPSGDEGARQAVLDVGRAVAGALESGGEVPALVTRMPASGLDPASVCYLRSPQILNAHVFVGGDDLFGLGPGGRGGGRESTISVRPPVHLVLVRYPDEATAETVERRVRAEERGGDGGRPAMVIGRNGECWRRSSAPSPTTASRHCSRRHWEAEHEKEPGQRQSSRILQDRHGCGGCGTLRNRRRAQRRETRSADEQGGPHPRDRLW